MAQPQPLPPTPSTQTIILLEQNKIQQDDPNGTFTINLKHPVVLNNGESISLSKSYIDTSSLDTDFITITPEDSEVVIKSGLYVNDLEPNITGSPPTRPTFGNWSGQVGDRPRGTTYILQNHSEANLHTFLDWAYINNKFTPADSTAFNVELTTIDAALVELNTGLADYLNVAEYVITGKPDLEIPATDPTQTGEVIEQKFLLNGFMNLVTENNVRELYYYHRSTTAAQIADPTGNAHVAVFTIWNDSTGRKGWKGKANPNTTFPLDAGQPVLGKWTFLSDSTGFNYFSDGGQSFNRKLTTIKFPFDSNWTAGLPQNPDYYPGVAINYIDVSSGAAKGVNTQVSHDFRGYPPSASVGGVINENAGIELLVKQLDKPKPPFSKSIFIKHDSLPEDFKNTAHGWSRGWYWYEWTAWKDPLGDANSKLTFEPIEFDLHNPPVLTTPTFDAKGNPRDRAFGNQASQFGTTFRFGVDTGKWAGNTLQPFQMITAPVSNPQSIGCTLTPRQYTTKFTIPPRDYTYSDLAQFITDNLNLLESPVLGLQNNPNDPLCPRNAAGYSNTYLIQDTYSLSMQYDGLATDPEHAPVPNPTFYPNNYTFAAIDSPARVALDIQTGLPFDLPKIDAQLITEQGHQPFWVSEAGDSVFQFDAANVFTGVIDPTTATPTTGPRMCGAENFSVIFDDSSQRFKILQAHTPIYINGPELSAAGAKVEVFGPGSSVIKQVGGEPNSAIGFKNEALVIDTSSGVILYDLQPASLWFNKMGFPTSILTQTGITGEIHNFAETGSDFLNNADFTQVKTFPMSLKTGVNKTGYFTSVDLLVEKQGGYARINPAGGQDIETSTPVGLDGGPLITSGDDQPFYNIEMSGINNQDFMGQTYNNSLIQGLVGKYYSSGNFTESQGDGIQYIHKGETPLVIQSIRTRILNTQLLLEEKLGPHSCFILTINKTK